MAFSLLVSLSVHTYMYHFIINMAQCSFQGITTLHMN